MAEEYTPTTAQVRQLYANSMDPTGFDRWLAAHDAELRAEVERLREVSAAQPYETERELAVALDEAQRQVADLRAGIERIRDALTAHIVEYGPMIDAEAPEADLTRLLAGGEA